MFVPVTDRPENGVVFKSFNVAPLDIATVEVLAAFALVVCTPATVNVPPVKFNLASPLVGVAEWTVVRAMLPLKLRAVTDEAKVNV